MIPRQQLPNPDTTTASTEGAAERQATFGRKAAERAPADPDKTTGQDWTIQIHRTGLIEKRRGASATRGRRGVEGGGRLGAPPALYKL